MGWRWKPPLLSHRPAPAWMYEGGPRSSDWPRADRRGRETRGWSRSFPALLDVGLDELLGVLLQHGVDLVEDVVHLLLELLALGGGFGLPGLAALAPALLLDPLLLLLRQPELLSSRTAFAILSVRNRLPSRRRVPTMGIRFGSDRDRGERAMRVAMR